MYIYLVDVQSIFIDKNLLYIYIYAFEFLNGWIQKETNRIPHVLQ